MRRPARGFVLLAAVLAGLLAGPGRAQQEFAVLSTVQVAEGEEVDAAALADFDGDGARDLVVASHAFGRSYDRHLRIHLRLDRKIAFNSEADRAIALTPDVVAFCPGDVDPAPGAEIVLFTATGAFAWKTGAPEREAPAKLAETDFLWPLPHPRAVFCWREGLTDVDGDGRDDLLLPEPDGFRIRFQDRGPDGAARFERTSFLEVPIYEPAGGKETVEAARERLKNLRSSLSLGSPQGESDDFLSVRSVLPFPILVDFDGDGRRDLMAQTTSDLDVWRQGAAGRFAADPDHVERLPIEVDTGRRLDFSFSARARDLDGDARADYVVVAGDRRSEAVRTQVLVYVQGKSSPGSLFGEKGSPSDVLFIGGFGGLLDLSDVNGDSLPDLLMGSIRVDALDAIRAAAKGDLDAVLHVYLNHGGRFSRRPDLEIGISIPAKNIERVGREVTARFLGDLTGTGASELLLRDDPERLRILALRRTGTGLQAFPNPLFETRVERRAELVVDTAGRVPEVLVIEDRQVQHLRFPR